MRAATAACEQRAAAQQHRGLSPHGAPPTTLPLPKPHPQSCPLPLHSLPLPRACHATINGPWARPWLPSHGEPHTILFFFMGWPKRIHMTPILQSPPSILSEMNSNLWILWDSVFQLNSDFNSNSNLNPSGLLPHPYIILGAPPPHIPMTIPPPNQALAATRVPPSLLLPIVATTSIPKPSLQIKPCVGHEKQMT
jgi:hypothetical protein